MSFVEAGRAATVHAQVVYCLQVAWASLPGSESRVCVCVYIYICICICVYVYIYMYVCMHVYTDSIKCRHTCGIGLMDWASERIARKGCNLVPVCTLDVYLCFFLGKLSI